jgi:pSer/pThr/pTyr-binding forkhead associated (FHA) protein
VGDPVIVEVVDHRGRVRQRHRLTADRLTVGRGYDNDLIVDDPYVDARQLVLGPDLETGALIVSDPGSTNGTWTGERRWSSGPLRPGLTLRIGRTTLRFVSPDEAVAPTLPDRRRVSWLGAVLLSPIRAALLAAVGFTVVAFVLGLDDTEAVTVGSLLPPTAWALLLGAAWAGAWALGTRLALHQFRFTAHLAWVALVAVGGLAMSGAMAWAGFLAPDAGIVPVASAVSALGLGALLLAGHLGLATEWERGRRWRVAAAATAVLVVGGVALTWNDGVADPTRSTGFAPVLRPLSARFIPTETPDQFFRTTDRLVGQLDRLVERPDRLAGDEDR